MVGHVITQLCLDRKLLFILCNTRKQLKRHLKSLMQFYCNSNKLSCTWYVFWLLQVVQCGVYRVYPLLNLLLLFASCSVLSSVSFYFPTKAKTWSACLALTGWYEVGRFMLRFGGTKFVLMLAHWPHQEKDLQQYVNTDFKIY